MKVYCYNEPYYEGSDIKGNKVVRLYRAEVLQTYWNFWSSEMTKRNKEHLISEDNCIRDFLVVNCGWEEEINDPIPEETIEENYY